MNTERKVNRVVKLERSYDECLGWHITAYLEDGTRTLFGKTHMTKVGSKRELTIWAKRYRMVKSGDVATII